MIYILTGAIRTGKTTALIDWSKTRNDVDGLLSPDNDNGKRYFLKIKLKQAFELEAESENEEVIVIGNFKFLKTAFKEANEFLSSLISNKENQYIIIDELGKLEFKNEGLYSSSKKLISQFILDKKQHVILVVRDYLLSEIIEHYHISDYKLITKEDLAKNSLA